MAWLCLRFGRIGYRARQETLTIPVMKKRSLLILLWAALAYSPVKAQDSTTSELPIQKGKVLLGTYFEFLAGTVEKTRISPRPSTKSDLISASINITVGKMLSDRWGLLLLAGYSNSSTTTPVTVGPNSTTFEDFAESYSIAPAVRYYAPISEEVWFFMQGAAFISRGKTSTDEFDGTSKVNIKLNTRGWGFGISPGISYFLTDKLSSEISIGLLGYSVLSGDDGKGNETTARTFQSLLYLNSVSLGFVYYL